MTALQVTPDELDLLRGCVGNAQRSASSNYAKATDAVERDWLANQMVRLEALRAKLDAPLAADTSQDAEPDEEDAE